MSTNKNSSLLVILYEIAVKTFPILENPILYAFLFCFLYWLYLFLTTTPYIKYDAETFVQLGKTIYEGGWAGFFKNEPNYVPLYPYLISVAIQLGNHFEVSFEKFQVFFQIIILLATQALIFLTCRKLKMSKIVTALVILYFGISPAIVNSTFSLYSEIATYPCVILAVFVAGLGWQALTEGDFLKIFVSSILLSFIFVILTMTNAIFEYITMIFLGAYLLSGIVFLFRRQTKLFAGVLFFVFLIFIVFTLAVTPYRMMNLQYNGHKALVIKGAWSLYGNTFRRTQDLSKEQIRAAIAYIPGEGVCRKKFSKDACDFWSVGTQHGIGMRKLKMLRAEGVPNKEIDSKLIELSKQMAFKKPGQYVLLTFFESLKMFFWESTQVGYVFYPKGLENLYHREGFKNGLRLLVSVITVISFLFFLGYLFKNFRKLYDPDFKNRAALSFLFACAIMLFGYIGMHSFFCIATRYAFPIVSLYMILIGLFLQKTFFCKIRDKE